MEKAERLKETIKQLESSIRDGRQLTTELEVTARLMRTDHDNLEGQYVILNGEKEKYAKKIIKLKKRKAKNDQSYLQLKQFLEMDNHMFWEEGKKKLYGGKDGKGGKTGQ